MKIITNDYVYMQVKDFLTIANLYGPGFAFQYNEYKKQGRKDTDFILVSDEGLIGKVLDCDEIVNFTDYSGSSITIDAMVSVLESRALLGNTTANKSMCDDLRDIILYKKGELGYQIPLIPVDDVIMCKDYIIRDTILENVYILSRTSLEPIDTDSSIYNTMVQSLLQCRYYGYKLSDLNIKVYYDMDRIALKITPLVKKEEEKPKQNIFKRLIKKLNNKKPSE